MNTNFDSYFTQDVLDALFPSTRADEFFEALYGDTEEGAYDIRLVYLDSGPQKLEFALELNQRPGKCLVCSLTYGLPTVFTKHPLINIEGIVKEIEKIMGNEICLGEWEMGRTKEISRERHQVPLTIKVQD